MIPVFIDKSQIPHKSGVYIFKDEKGNVLYVGKAVDLYNRVSSYFSDKNLHPKTASLVEKISQCETIIVFSEVEALILEANLIKRYLPPYNIRLTDDKDYLYIIITDELFPRIITGRKKDLLSAKEYFGPFPSSTIVKSTLKKLRKIFTWCNNPPKGEIKLNNTDAFKKLKPCFYYHLGLCSGACIGKVSAVEYQAQIRLFSKFLQCKKEELIEQLTKQMLTLSEDQQFEQAQRVKKMIDGINYLTQPNKIDVYLQNPNFIEDESKQSLHQLQKILKLPTYPSRIECFDISNIQGKFAVGSMTVLTDGNIDKKSYRRFKIKVEGKSNDFAMMAEVIRRRIKHREWPTPDLMLIDGGRGQVRAAFEELLKADLTIPVFGLAKRTEWLYSPQKEIIRLPKSLFALRLLQKVRDEAHRFAIKYHRRLRYKDIFYSLK